jgi:hypothetical protein
MDVRVFIFYWSVLPVVWIILWLWRRKSSTTLSSLVMQNKHIKFILLGCLFLLPGCKSFNYNQIGWISLFNGKDLTGWTVKCQPQDKDKTFWKVEDGAILCDSIGRKDHNYVWLCSAQEFGDFEMQFKFQAYTNSPGNSGLQFRSRFDDSYKGGWLDGPQMDIHPPAAMNWRTGLIYDETREERRWIFPSLKDSSMDQKYKPARHVFKYSADGWNEMTIRCQGTCVKTILNGIVVTDWDGAGVFDNEAHRRHNVGLNGHFALQLHTGDQLRIKFKDMRVRKL